MHCIDLAQFVEQAQVAPVRHSLGKPTKGKLTTCYMGRIPIGTFLATFYRPSHKHGLIFAKRLSGAKALGFIRHFAARPKPCPFKAGL